MLKDAIKEGLHVSIVACPHPLSCCIYTALVSLLFGTVIPTSFNILMEMFYFPLHMVLACKYNALCVCVSPTHFATRGHVKCT